MSHFVRVMSRDGGGLLSGAMSLRQRVFDCLRFRRGSLVGARDYGSDLDSLLDRNITHNFIMDAFMEITETLGRPINGVADFRLDSIGVTSIDEGHIEFVLSGSHEPSGEQLTIEGVRFGRG